ncbi:hypothetical protein FRB98_008006 [Tulasnella sp. 332]|nr:hypothetical protein FRB98_008006 [Tulasnella sp. 332]
MEFNVVLAPVQVFKLFHGPTERLQHVKLGNVRLEDWRTSVPTNLKSLDLCIDRDVPTFDVILQLLVASPDLEQLRSQLTEHNPRVFTPPATPIVLKRPRQFDLVSMPHAAISLLLRNIQTPKCQVMTVKMPKEEDRFVLDTVTSFAPPLLTPLHGDLTPLTLLIGPGLHLNEFGLHSTSGQEVRDLHLRFEGLHFDMDTLLSWVNRLSNPVHVGPTPPDISIVLDSLAVKVEGFPPLLDLKGMKELVFKTRASPHLLKMLSAPSAAGVWPCPNVQVIRLENCWESDFAAVIDMLRCLMSRAPASLGSTVSEGRGPVALECLHIQSCKWMDNEVLEEMEHVLGSGVVAWKKEERDY